MHSVKSFLTLATVCSADRRYQEVAGTSSNISRERMGQRMSVDVPVKSSDYTSSGVVMELHVALVFPAWDLDGNK